MNVRCTCSEDALSAVAVVTLHEHDLLSDGLALLGRAEADDRAQARVGLLVAVRDTHTTTDRDVETLELAVVADDGDVAEVVGEDVDVVGRRDSDGDLEL